MRDSDWNDRAARRRQRAIDTEASVVRHDLVLDEPGRLAQYGLGFVVALLVGLPILFGGVHATVYGPVEVGIFALLVVLAWRATPALSALFRQGTTSRAFARAAVIFCGYIVLRAIAEIVFSSTVHPVLGAGAQLAAMREIAAWIRELLVFFAAYLAVRSLLVLHPRALDRLTDAVIVAGVVTATIGLSHWFYDNGRLFWLFEPENVFISQRARWPFVNSNHLACFLIPALFLLIGRCFTESAGLRSATISQRTGRMKSIADLSSDERFQKKIVRLTVTAILGLTVLLCIIATLSRGVWLATIVGLLSFVALDRLSRPSETTPQPIGVPAAEPRSGHRSSRRRRRTARSTRPPFTPSAASLRTFRLLALVLVCGAIYLFLRDRGAELVESRIEYGLLHSKEDMRFQLLTDTWPLIATHPWFGLGIDGWATAHAAVMSPLLAGINPVYLHNDPAQLLAEVGIVGLLLAVWCLGVVLVGGTRSLRNSPNRITQVALLSAILAIAVATLFDFHLRIPAIVLQLAVVISLIIDLTDLRAKKEASVESHSFQQPS